MNRECPGSLSFWAKPLILPQAVASVGLGQLFQAIQGPSMAQFNQCPTDKVKPSYVLSGDVHNSSIVYCIVLPSLVFDYETPCQSQVFAISVGGPEE